MKKMVSITNSLRLFFETVIIFISISGKIVGNVLPFRMKYAIIEKN